MKPAPRSSAPAVAVRQLGLAVGAHFALRELSLDLSPGSATALLGENGSGKSTLLRIIAGLQRPARGQVRIDGREAPWRRPALRARIGYLPQRTPAADPFTVREALAAAARLAGVAAPRRRVAELLAECRLEALADRRSSALSPGVLRRFGLAQALIGDPDLLLLDEPTAGMDAGQRAWLGAWLRALRGRTTMLMATHDPAAALGCAEGVVVLRGGRIAARYAPEFGDRDLVLRIEGGDRDPQPDAAEVLRRQDDGRWLMRLRAGRAPADLVAELAGAGVRISEVLPARRDAEASVRLMMSEGS